MRACAPCCAPSSPSGTSETSTGPTPRSGGRGPCAMSTSRPSTPPSSVEPKGSDLDQFRDRPALVDAADRFGEQGGAVQHYQLVARGDIEPERRHAVGHHDLLERMV